MNKAFIGAGIALGLALAGCNNSQGVFPVGIPTVILSVTNINNTFTPFTPAVGTTPAVPEQYVLSGKIEVRAQKGSVAGTIVAFKSGSASILPGPFVEACPITSAKDCGPFTNEYRLTFSSFPPPQFLSSFVVQGLNGTSAEIFLAVPIPLNRNN